MNYFAIVNGINSVCALIIAIIIVLNQSRKEVHLVYAFFYVLLFLWASCYFMWGIQTELTSSMVWMQLLEYPVCLIHIAYFHFALLFAGNLKLYKRQLFIGYALSAFFLWANANNLYFDMSYVRNRAPFLFWPHATHWLSAFIAFQFVYLLMSFLIIFKTIKFASGLHRTRLKLFLFLAIVGWTGGLTNWFHFYDSTPVDPIGNPAVTIYLIGSAYLIFKHDILGLNIAVKKTFVYALLTLFITLIYTFFILISEKFFQSFIGYNSFAIILLLAMTIALLFNPVRLFLNKFIDKLFFGKDIYKLSSENDLMRDELAKRDRMKAVSTLAAGMAHEIKNPLTSIKTFAEYLPKKYDDPGFRSKFSKLVVDEVDRVSSIVQQLLDFAKPADPELKSSNLAEILDETLALLTSNLLKARVELVKSIDSTLFVMVDKNQLKQALLNLVLNAIQSMPIGGTLNIATKGLQNKLVTITITDTGAGINKEHLPHIFDPFYTTKEGGTGLGLAIVHSIITKHGGKIDVQSTVGSGTTVTITLKRNLT